MVKQATRQRVRKMFKYFKNKKVLIRYEYNNSIGWHDIRYFNGRYDNFEVTPDEEYYNVILY